MRRVPRRLLAAGVGVATFAATASAAFAHAPTGEYANFAQCPVSNPNVSNCVYSKTTSGSFNLPKLSVPITNPIVFQGGYGFNADGSESFYGAANGQTLSNSPDNVPGGLLGLTPPNLFPQPLQGILNAAINSANGVTATAELVGNPQFNVQNFFDSSGPTVTLPIRFQLNNPFLGSSCYIGSASNPITLNLTDGTTTPPAGTKPITGSEGTLTFSNDGNVTTANGDSLVDNAFAVPGASGGLISGCGGVFSSLIVPILDAKAGIPAAAGKSSAILNGLAQITDAPDLIANENS